MIEIGIMAIAIIMVIIAINSKHTGFYGSMALFFGTSSMGMVFASQIPPSIIIGAVIFTAFIMLMTVAVSTAFDDSKNFSSEVKVSSSYTPRKPKVFG